MKTKQKPAAKQKPAVNPEPPKPARDCRGRFLPGQSPNPGGRSKALAEVRELARAHTEDAIATLAEIMESGPPAARVAAACAILDRGWGRPAVAVEINAQVNGAGMVIATRIAEEHPELADLVFGPPRLTGK